MRQTFARLGALALAPLIWAGCAGQPAAPAAPAAPSPTIAAAQLPTAPAGAPARPSPSPSSPAARPTATATAAPAPATPEAGQAPAAEPSIYLWPAELPAGLAVASAESRVSADGEVGPTGMGFYIITLNAGAQKLVIGGGDLGEALPLAGSERPVTIGQRTAKLITKDQQRELLFDVARGKLFVYGLNIDEQELLRVAASLQPIDVRALRALAGAK